MMMKYFIMFIFTLLLYSDFDDDEFEQLAGSGDNDEADDNDEIFHHVYFYPSIIQ